MKKKPETLKLYKRSSKRRAIQPQEMMKELKLEDGQLVKYIAEDKKLVVETVRDPIELALKSRKWAKTTIREFEQESQEEQSELYG